MSRIPRMEVYLNDESVLTIAHHRLADRGPLEVPIPLDELMADGPDESARRLGSILIHVLMLWHKEEFARIAAGAAAQSQAISDMDLVDSLISKSISLKTNAHVGSIEHLLANSADESGECEEFSTLTWPTIRAELLKYGDDGVM